MQAIKPPQSKNKKPRGNTPVHRRSSLVSGSTSVDSLTVRLPRSRLSGYYGLPYSGEVHLPTRPDQLILGDELITTSVAVQQQGWAGQQHDADFTIAPGVTDQTEAPPQKGEADTCIWTYIPTML